MAIRLHFLLASFLFATVVCAQPFIADHENDVKLGIEGTADANMHSANFPALPGVPNCCPQFGSGTGFGYAIGAQVEVPMAHAFAVNVRLNYVSNNATLTADEGTTIIVNNTLTDGTFHHTLWATLASVGYELLGVYTIAGGFKAQAGLRGAYVVTKTYSQQEEITSPSSATFVDSNGNDTHSRLRNQFNGVIPSASSFDFGLLGGLRFDLPMNPSHTLILAPEIMYSLGLSPVVSGLSWNANALRFGVSILYALPPSTRRESGGRP